MKENTYIYREIMDKLNESPMLVNNYLLSSLRSDDHAKSAEQVEKCYSGLLDEYGKVGISGGCVGRTLGTSVCCVTWSWSRAFYTRATRRWTSI